MEKTSSFERVVGKFPGEDKKEILQEAGEIFSEQSFENMEKIERGKTSRELEIISLANKATNELRTKYDLDKFDIPAKNIHIIQKEFWSDEKSTAHFASMCQGIALCEQSAGIVFMEKIFHEMLHFKSYNALQIIKEGNSELGEYRVGLTMHSRDNKEFYFVNINEAVTEEMTRIFIRKLSENSLFKKEIKQTIDIIKKYPREKSASGELIFNNDTYFAEIIKERGGMEHIAAKEFTYSRERKILDILIDKLFEINSDKFKRREDVFEVFAKSMMTGNILPLGRLIDGTFGKGTFRKIGELDDDIEAQEKLAVAL